MNKTLEKLNEITYVMIDVENHPNSVFYIVIKRIPGSLLEMEELRLHVYFTFDIMNSGRFIVDKDLRMYYIQSLLKLIKTSNSSSILNNNGKIQKLCH
ncbi:unnamed protein product [Schistosoma haematobium]|nr:unnamed protein product [Schistosoma haematobium]CAH8464503.1 unnamed protein product [Schistosoma haematobium]